MKKELWKPTKYADELGRPKVMRSSKYEMTSEELKVFLEYPEVHIVCMLQWYVYPRRKVKRGKRGAYINTYDIRELEKAIRTADGGRWYWLERLRKRIAELKTKKGITK